ncbi:IclR family transcriptional regulator (plasmid) [Halorarum halophilum]|uniref:IclR family transcriptional regulator n=1 Tax=Halorarum halophilum TaxID=2743090 RepID=A0A7D5KGN0_9EURY|nr:IclR family transcriptional regulator [Halobaculum halophilum]QLG29937.1 IclR family transcriptional regulator [Halobaculum halophilum]
MTKESTEQLNSVSFACDVLNALDNLGGAGVTELAKKLDCSKSTAHRQLTTLYNKEYLVKDGDQYRIGFKCLDMAAHVRDQIDNYDVIREEIDNLAVETGETAQFATEEHGRVVYLYKARGENGVQTSSNVGTREFFHCTSLGKVMMANMSEDQIDEIIERHGLPAKTVNTVTDRESLREAFEQIRERGYAIDDEENVQGLRCVAAPVFQGKDILGAVSVSGPSRRMEGERFDEEIPKNVTRSANVIELNSKFA